MIVYFGVQVRLIRNGVSFNSEYTSVWFGSATLGFVNSRFLPSGTNRTSRSRRGTIGDVANLMKGDCRGRGDCRSAPNRSWRVAYIAKLVG